MGSVIRLHGGGRATVTEHISEDWYGIEFPNGQRSAIRTWQIAEIIKTPQTPPLTNAEFSRHIASVRERVMAAVEAGMTTAHQNKVDGRYTAERQRLHREIVEDLYQRAKNVPNDGKVIMSGGLAGAGKTSTLRKHARVDTSQYITVNTDDVKAEFARRGLIPRIPGLAPMEGQMLIREESAHVTSLLTERVINDRKNVIFDVVMGPGDNIPGRLERLSRLGYQQFRAIFVDVTIEVALQRAEGRYRAGLEEYRNGRGYGERWAPWEGMLANRSTDPRWRSINRALFEEVRDQFQTSEVWDNAVDGRDPILLDRRP